MNFAICLTDQQSCPNTISKIDKLIGDWGPWFCNCIADVCNGGRQRDTGEVNGVHAGDRTAGETVVLVCLCLVADGSSRLLFCVYELSASKLSALLVCKFIVCELFACELRVSELFGCKLLVSELFACKLTVSDLFACSRFCAQAACL